MAQTVSPQVQMLQEQIADIQEKALTVQSGKISALMGDLSSFIGFSSFLLGLITLVSTFAVLYIANANRKAKKLMETAATDSALAKEKMQEAISLGLRAQQDIEESASNVAEAKKMSEIAVQHRKELKQEYEELQAHRMQAEQKIQKLQELLQDEELWQKLDDIEELQKKISSLLYWRDAEYHLEAFGKHLQAIQQMIVASQKKISTLSDSKQEKHFSECVSTFQEKHYTLMQTYHELYKGIRTQHVSPEPTQAQEVLKHLELSQGKGEQLFENCLQALYIPLLSTLEEDSNEHGD